MSREMKFRTSPLAACGCYAVVVVINLAFWAVVIAVIATVVRLAYLAWFGR